MPGAHTRQALLHQHSVVVVQRYNIGDRTECYKIQITRRNLGSTNLPLLFQQAPYSGHQIKGNTDTGEIAAGKSTALEIRIYDYCCVRQFVARQMMVRDQHRNLQLVRSCDAVGTGDAVIDSDQ